MFCFSNSDHVMLPREFAFSLFINYAFICRSTFERNSGVPSRGLKWENEKEKLERAIPVLNFFQAKGLCTWRWGTPGRRGNPLR